MNSFKTAVVVLFMVAVVYGVYVVLNKPDERLPPSLAWNSSQAPEAPRLGIDLGAPRTSPANAPAANNPSATDLRQPSIAAPNSSTLASPVGAFSSLASPPANVPPLVGKTAETDGPPAWLADGGVRPVSRTESAPLEPDEPSPYARRPQSKYHVGDDAESLASGRGAAAESLGALGFEKARRQYQAHLDSGRHYEALETLSAFYKSPDLTDAEQRWLLAQLDPLAGRVIYSTEHLCDEPYVTGRDESLVDIAARYKVPYQLLQNINGIKDPLVLVPRTELKVVRGPFRAEVDLAANELTLFLGKLYAGWFPIEVGADPAPRPGDFEIREKSNGRPFYGRDRTVAVNDPNNPYGRAWLDLGNDLCIHGSPTSGTRVRAVCIGLSPRDANDVYGILGVGSRVSIRP